MNDPSSPESDVQAVEKLGEARDGVVKELPSHPGNCRATPESDEKSEERENLHKKRQVICGFLF